jgi:hypothetical protein
VETERRAGRIAGALIVAQMVAGFAVNFVLEAPLFGAPGFLVNAAPHAGQVALGALVGLAAEATWLAVAVIAFPVLHRLTGTLAIWFVALAAVVLAAAVLETAGVMSLVSVGQTYANAAPGDREQLQAVRVVVSSARNWSHYLARILDGITIFTFAAALYRSAVVPRSIAVLGLVAAPVMIAGVAMPFFGRDVVFPMLAPLGLSQLILAGWLVSKGFRKPTPDRVTAGREG